MRVVELSSFSQQISVIPSRVKKKAIYKNTLQDGSYLHLDRRSALFGAFSDLFFISF